MVALVTGGGRGIGRAIALGLAKQGWEVAVTARSADELTETVKLAEGKVIAIPGDVSDRNSVKAVARSAGYMLGPVDLLVNNAGTGGPFGPFWESNVDEWWRCQEVNLRGPMLLCRELIPGMIARQSGRIINLVSGAGVRAYPDMSAYVTSKTALIRFSEQLALELKPHGISVFPIRPGMVRTAMLEQARHHLPFLQKSLDQGVDVPPEAAAGLVGTLASGIADSLSGHLFSVGDDVGEIVRREGAVRENELYLLRVRSA
ncbi:MAG TPA: SDR family oxidoreductase [Bryobacteraceae bacterium]|nr:SDR family oxidoreductase [Bryobacteraceae bacterium]